MMAKRKPAPEYRTTFSFADRYIEQRRNGEWERITVKFPLIEDRRAPGNIKYSADHNRRTWRGEVPRVGRPNDEKSIKGSYRLDDAEFINVAEGEPIDPVPDGYIATKSGIYPLLDPYFTEGPQQGYATNERVIIDSNFENNVHSGNFFVADSIKTSNMRGERYPYRFCNPDTYSKDTRLSWKILPGFDNPTEPNIRYPKRGAKKIKGFG